jgi:tetratricopeptide (TPR) repeat protein
MILRLSDSLSRGLVVVAALLVGLWLSFFGIRAAIARYGADGDTARRLELAVRLEPGNPAYWYLLGRYQQYNLEQPDSALAQSSYRKAIALNPLATDAWLDLGTAYELEGKSEEARESYLQARKSYPISADVSWRYGNFLLREGALPEAYAELRCAIDADPHRAAAAFSRAYRANPNIDEILAQLLPAKQSVYVDVIAEALDAKQLAVAKIVWTQLLTLHPHLAIREVDRLVSQLLFAGEFPEARRVWDQGVATMNLPPLLQPQGSVVWDPSFESDITDYSFAWHFQPLMQGVSISFDKTERLSGNQSLRLSFDGKHNPNLEAACALGIVQPGTTYHFSGWIKTKDITTEHGVGFRIFSYGTPGGPVLDTRTRQIYGNNPFTLIDQSWTAGPDVHAVRICVIRDPSDNPEVRISGNAWVDDVNLVPQPAGHHKP